MSNVPNTKCSINITNSRVVITFPKRNVENENTEKKKTERKVDKSKGDGDIFVEDRSLHNRQVKNNRESSYSSISASEEISSQQRPKRKAKTQITRPQHEKRQKIDGSMDQGETQPQARNAIILDNLSNETENNPDLSLLEILFQNELYLRAIEIAEKLLDGADNDKKSRLLFALIHANIMLGNIEEQLKWEEELNKLLISRFPQSPYYSEKYKYELYFCESKNYLEQKKYCESEKLALIGIEMKIETQLKFKLYMVLVKACEAQDKIEVALKYITERLRHLRPSTLGVNDSKDELLVIYKRLRSKYNEQHVHIAEVVNSAANLDTIESSINLLNCIQDSGDEKNISNDSYDKDNEIINKELVESNSIDIEIQTKFALLEAALLEKFDSNRILSLKFDLDNLLKQKYPKMTGKINSKRNNTNILLLEEEKAELYQRASQKYLNQKEYAKAEKIAYEGIERGCCTHARVHLSLILGKARFFQEKFEEASKALHFISITRMRPSDFSKETAQELHDLVIEVNRAKKKVSHPTKTSGSIKFAALEKDLDLNKEIPMIEIISDENQDQPAITQKNAEVLPKVSYAKQNENSEVFEPNFNLPAEQNLFSETYWLLKKGKFVDAELKAKECIESSSLAFSNDEKASLFLFLSIACIKQNKFREGILAIMQGKKILNVSSDVIQKLDAWSANIQKHSGYAEFRSLTLQNSRK